MLNVPYPGLWDAASGLANQQLQAQLGSVRRSSRRETRQGQRYIRRLAHSFADELGQISSGVQGSYNQYAGALDAADAALVNYMQGGGQQMMADLSSQLSFSPEAAAYQGGKAGAVGDALAKVGAGFGSQNQQAFLGEAASNVAYSKALPGMAALSGIQTAGAFQQQQASDLKAQRDAILSQAPGLTADLYSAFAGQAQAQAQMAQAERFHRDDMRQQADAARLQGLDRVDQARSDAADILGTFAVAPVGPGGTPLPGYKGPTYADAYSRISAIFRQRFPGRSDSWVRAETNAALAQFGITPLQQVADVAGTLPGILGSAIGGFTSRYKPPAGAASAASFGGGGGTGYGGFYGHPTPLSPYG